MFSLSVKNQNQEILELTNSQDYTVLNIDGLLPVNANINTGVLSGMDGVVFNSARADKRNIVLTIKPKRDIEKSRIQLYKFFRTKNRVEIHYKNQNRNVFTEGYVESFSGSLFTDNELFQISIICPKPYFLSEEVKDIKVTNIEPLFEFPFAIESSGIEVGRYTRLATKDVFNEGDVAVGMVITLLAQFEVKNPILHIRDTGQFFSLNYQMEENEIVEINTERGRKSVLSNKNGTIKNILNCVSKGSTWLQLNPGSNLFVYDAEAGGTNLYTSFSFRAAYGGV